MVLFVIALFIAVTASAQVVDNKPHLNVSFGISRPSITQHADLGQYGDASTKYPSTVLELKTGFNLKKFVFSTTLRDSGTGLIQNTTPNAPIGGVSWQMQNNAGAGYRELDFEIVRRIGPASIGGGYNSTTLRTTESFKVLGAMVTKGSREYAENYRGSFGSIAATHRLHRRFELMGQGSVGFGGRKDTYLEDYHYPGVSQVSSISGRSRTWPNYRLEGQIGFDLDRNTTLRIGYDYRHLTNPRGGGSLAGPVSSIRWKESLAVSGLTVGVTYTFRKS
jgi:hypothetical protein